MSHDLLTQLSEYGTYCDERQGTVTADDITDAVMPLPMPTQPTRPRQGWLIAAAAAAVVLLVAGGLALLAPFSGNEVAPINEPAVTTIPTPMTIPATTLPAPEPVATTTVPQTTLAVATIVPPDEGPKLEFVPTELPSGEWLRDGVWFQDALYAISANDLYRSVDGLNWEVVPGSRPLDSWIGGTKTDGERLVYVSGADSQGNCLASGASIQVNTSTDGVEWTSSEIPLPLPVTSSNTGCFNSYGVDFAVGPRGTVVATNVFLEIGGGFMRDLVDPDEGIHIEVAAIDLERGVVTIRLIEEETGEIVETAEIDELGKSLGELLDGMEADPLWEPLIGPLLQNMAENGPGVSRGLAWFSADGKSWQTIGDVGPLQGANTPSIASIVATTNGFVATSEVNGWPLPPGPVQDVLWHSVDGTTWTEGAGLVESHLSGSPHGLDMWDGRLVAVTRKGVWTIDDTPQQLITASMGVMEIGEFGLIGMHSEMDGGGTEVLFSADGTSWNRWTPPEFGPEFGTIYVVGIGDDFVVLRLITQAGESHWVGRLP